MSVHWFSLLKEWMPSLRTHFISLDLPDCIEDPDLISQYSQRSMQVKSLEVVPLESIVRGCKISPRSLLGIADLKRSDRKCLQRVSAIRDGPRHSHASRAARKPETRTASLDAKHQSWAGRSRWEYQPLTRFALERPSVTQAYRLPKLSKSLGLTLPGESSNSASRYIQRCICSNSIPRLPLTNSPLRQRPMLLSVVLSLQTPNSNSALTVRAMPLFSSMKF